MKLTIRFASIIIFFVLVLFTIPLSSQVSQEWSKRYDDPINHYNDRAYCMAVDHNGNPVVVGETNGDWIIIKYSASGDTLWKMIWGTSSTDIIKSITIDKYNCVYVTGYFTSGSAVAFEDILIRKYSSEGDLIWSTQFSQNYYDYSYAITVDDSGYTYVTGYSSSLSSNTSYDIVTLKLDQNGYFSSTWADEGKGIGVRINTGSGLYANDYGKDIAVDNAGNVYVLASTEAGSSGSRHELLTLKYDARGELKWSTSYHGTIGDNTPIKLAIDNLGNIYVTGTSLGQSISGNDYNDIVTIKYDSAGVEKWVNRFNGPANQEDRCYDMVIDNFSNIYVAGSSYTSNGTDFVTIKYDSLGAEKWVKYFDASYQNIDEARSIAIDQSGNIYVTGTSVRPGTSNDFSTISYNNNGDFRWSIFYNGSDNLADIPAKVVVDEYNNVYVGGSSGSLLNWDDIVTIKYSQLTSVEDQPQPANVNNFTLYQNYPNPFSAKGGSTSGGNPSTKISWQSPVGSWQTLKVYDVLGKEIATLVDEYKPAGTYEVEFQSSVGGHQLASGIYYYQLKAGDFIQTKKMILLR